VGFAGSTAAGDAAVAGLVDRALASADLGEEVALAFPGPAPLPPCATHDDRAAAASLDALVAIGRELVERLTQDGRQVNVGVQRAVSETAVGNTAGAAATYRETGVSVSAEVVRIGGDDVLMVYDVFAAAGLPAAPDIDRLVRSIEDRLAPARTVVAPPEGALPVVFTPAGLSALLLPLEHALSGKAVVQGVSPLAERVGERVLDPRLSFIDDPLQPGRPASRPIDDEGVVSRTTALIERGVVRGFVYDLETAARAGQVSTGHGRRGVFGKPRVGFTNLIFGTPAGPDAAPAAPLGGGLAAGIADGLLVDDLIGVGQGNVIGGAFSHPVGLAYRVRGGEIVGRVKDAAVAGNAYELLRAVGGVGADGRWLGSRWAASLLIEGVSVARR
jgi:PmbA protein